MRKHLQGAVRLLRPLFSRPIPIKLNAVVVGIAQIKRFAHAMVAGAFQRTFCNDQPQKRRGEGLRGRIKNSGMVKAGAPGRWWRAAFAPQSIEPKGGVVTPRRNKGGTR